MRSSFLAVVVAVLSSCARLQQTVPAAPAPPYGASVPPSGGESGDLLYVSAGCGLPPESGICIFAFPTGKYVGWIEHYAASDPVALCSDSAGNVYVTSILASGYEAAVLKYGHAGNGPMEILKDGQYSPNGCAVDPISGTLAVANMASGATPGNVALYANARGRPRYHKVDGIFSYYFCGYDHKGNLFVSGATKNGSVAIAELPKGKTAFVKISLNKPLYEAGPIQWDGIHLAFGYGDTKRAVIYRADVSGLKAKVVATTRLFAPKAPHANIGPFWIENKRIIATFKTPNRYPVAFWRYPDGGTPTRIIRHGRHVSEQGSVTVSVMPSR